MSAQTSDRPLQKWLPDVNLSYGLPFSGSSSGTQFYQGQMLILTGDDVLIPAQTASTVTGSVVVGCNLETNVSVSTTVPLSTQVMRYAAGTFQFANEGSITAKTLPGTLLYAVDDQTLSTTSSSGQRAVAGRLYQFVPGAQFPVVASVGVGFAVSGSTF